MAAAERTFMSKLIYRVISATGALGSGFSHEAFDKAIVGQVDAIIANAGSTATDPVHLAKGTSEFSRESIAGELRHILAAGLRLGCPVVIGNCGSAGGTRNLKTTTSIARSVLDELAPVAMKVAIIDSRIATETVVREFRNGALLATGPVPELSAEVLRDSTIVAQMGVHPIIAALQGGAGLILTGRCAGAALYAADMIQRGIDPGLAYHAGHILKSGTIACEGGSESGCLAGEIHDDGAVSFTSFAPDARVTAYSIASHVLYRESHPQLQLYPEGALVLSDTGYFSAKSGRAGFRGSAFHRSGNVYPRSVKLEGAVPVDDGEGANWSVCHLLLNDDIIRSELFPIYYFEASADRWESVGTEWPRYFDIGGPMVSNAVDGRTLSLIADVPPAGAVTGLSSLDTMAAVRGDTVGINRLTFDILFDSSEAYEQALLSNVFHKANVAALLGVPEHRIVGSFFADSCRAIKITLNSAKLTTSGDDDPESTAHYCAILAGIRIPIHANAPAETPGLAHAEPSCSRTSR